MIQMIVSTNTYPFYFELYIHWGPEKKIATNASEIFYYPLVDISFGNLYEISNLWFFLQFYTNMHLTNGVLTRFKSGKSISAGNFLWDSLYIRIQKNVCLTITDWINTSGHNIIRFFDWLVGGRMMFIWLISFIH